MLHSNDGIYEAIKDDILRFINKSEDVSIQISKNNIKFK